ncbi:hypothetical protein NWP96_01660 [Mycoplasmopsis cynos]|nr:hypothetical protein [Mycoplasmopsis cynos]
MRKINTATKTIKEKEQELSQKQDLKTKEKQNIKKYFQNIMKKNKIW